MARAEAARLAAARAEATRIATLKQSIIASGGQKRGTFGQTREIIVEEKRRQVAIPHIGSFISRKATIGTAKVVARVVPKIEEREKKISAQRAAEEKATFGELFSRRQIPAIVRKSGREVGGIFLKGGELVTTKLGLPALTSSQKVLCHFSFSVTCSCS